LLIVKVVSSGGKVIFTGTCHGAPGSGGNLEFFTSPKGTSSEGDACLGSLVNVILDAAGRTALRRFLDLPPIRH
jgi:hypothetical protein